MLRSGRTPVMLFRNGRSWDVIGPPDVVVEGATVEAYFPDGKTHRWVTVGRVVPYDGSYGDGTWVKGLPAKARRCGCIVSGKPCSLAYRHKGWCRA